MKKLLFSVGLILTVLGIQFALVGHSSPGTINSEFKDGGPFNSKDFGPYDLNGTSNHSVIYNFDGAVSIDVFPGYVNPKSGDVIYMDSAFATVTGTQGIEPLFLPVTQFIKFTVTGSSVTGDLVFNGA